MPSPLSLKLRIGVVRVGLRLGYFLCSISNIIPAPYWGRDLKRRSGKFTVESTKRKGKRIKVNVWNPQSRVNGEKSGKRPVHISLHSSGYSLPTFGSTSVFCEQLANELGITVLDVDYSKAPEHPFPAAYNDIIDVVTYVINNCGDIYDLNNLTLGGFSSGAALALVVASTARFPLLPSSDPMSGSKHPIKGVLSYYPPTDHSSLPPHISKLKPDLPPARKGATASPIHPVFQTLINNCYAPVVSTRMDPRVSPIHGDPSKFPKRIGLVLAERDTLRPEGERLRDKLVQAGVGVESVVIKDVGHAWDLTARNKSWEDERRVEAYQWGISFLRDTYAM